MSEENIRLSCTLDKNGNPTAQARMTATDDKQKCQMEIARRIPIMFVPGIYGFQPAIPRRLGGHGG